MENLQGLVNEDMLSKIYYLEVNGEVVFTATTGEVIVQEAVGEVVEE